MADDKRSDDENDQSLMFLSVECQYAVIGSAFDRRLLAAMVGLVLVMNPVYLYPAGGHYVQTYTFESERVDDSLTSALYDFGDSSVVFCDSLRHRVCAFERRIGPNGTMVVNDSAAVRAVGRNGELRSGYEYVFISGFYAPNATVSNGSAVLTLESVDATEVAERIARDYDLAPDVIRRAIDTGRGSVTYSTPGYPQPGPKPDHRVENYQHVLVEKDGTFYAIEGSGYHGRLAWYAKHLWAVRLVAVLVGFALLFWAFQHPAEE